MYRGSFACKYVCALKILLSTRIPASVAAVTINGRTTQESVCMVQKTEPLPCTPTCPASTNTNVLNVIVCVFVCVCGSLAVKEGLFIWGQFV